MPDLTILDQLDQFSLIGEGIKFRISCSNPYTDGTQSVMYLDFSNSIGSNLDKGFTLSWNGLSLSFLFVADPDNSGLQLSDNSQTGSLAAMLDLLAQELEANYYISKDFYISSSSGTHIEFISKLKSEVYDIVLSDNTVNGLVLSAFQNGLSILPLPNYRILAELFLWNDTKQISPKLGSDSIAPDQYNIAPFDLAQYISDQLQTAFHYPDGQQTFFILDNSCLRYFINYAEMYDGQVKKLHSTYDTPTYALKGGLSKQDRSFLIGQGESYFNYSAISELFLTWVPILKYTRKLSVERLFFIGLADTTYVLHASINLTNGMGFGLSIDTLYSRVTNIFEIVCDYASLNIDNSYDVESYDIFLSDESGNRVSEIRSFILDKQTYPEVRYFIYKNSFGVYDTIHTTGNGQLSTKYDRNEVEILEENEYTTHRSILKNYDITEQATYSVNTGPLHKEQLFALRDMLLSTEVYQINGSSLIPIVITSKKALQFKDRKHLFALNFTYSEAAINKYYSALSTQTNFITLDGLNVGLDETEGRLRF